MIFSRTHRKGFTLIELLVVMAIIGVMAGLVGVNVQGARNRAKNAKLIGSVKKIQNGFEQYFGVHQEYDGVSATCDTMFGDAEFFPQGDPSVNLTLDKSCTALTYCVCSGLVEVGGEYGGANSMDGGCTWVDPDLTDTIYKSHYCISQLQ